MKLRSLILSVCFCALVITSGSKAQAQDSIPDAKTGWNMGILPALGYDSNLGFLYGGIVNLFDYGNGERFPDYNQNLYMQLSTYTKGGWDAIVYFDSFTLIPEKQFTGRLSFTRNRAYPFYGFNGAQTNYNANWEDDENDDFVSQVFYKADRQVIKADAIVQDNFGDSDFKWMAGIDMGFYKIDTVDVNHLNDKRDDDDQLSTVPGLYNRYVKYGVISDEEKNGGWDNSLKLGLVYDTRDRLTNPMKGTWTEMIVRAAPKAFGNYNNFARMSIIHRQYFTVVKEKLSFAYRLWYESAFGDVPSYSRHYLTASNYYEGMGGSYTLRGVLMNRVVGKQTAIANIGLRWKAARFQAIGQNFYLGFNAFMDNGYILQGYDLDLSNVPEMEHSLLFSDDYKELVTAAGLGIKLAMNENFVISGEYGSSFDENYGTSGLYFQIGYIF